jgi:hypothetical protein
MTKASFKKNVNKVIKEWENTYRKETRNCNYCHYPFYYDSCIPENLDLLEDDEERKEAIDKAEESLNLQIDFIKKYTMYMALSGETKETLERIKQFLSYQHFEDKYFLLASKPEIEIVLQGGFSWIPLCVNINSFQEFDFADSWAEEGYDIIGISNNKWKTWTQNRIKRTIQDIKEDFEFDGYEVEINLESGKVGQPASEEISVQCIINE